ncbi:MAG TPA: DUF2179 domain-containing protein [bacterium]|nr:DUF2179 domain-containing protein [bacterium]
MTEMIDSNLFSWLILPLLIFFARITDVSIGTLRIMFIGRNKRTLAATLGFFEVLIWLLAIRQIFNNLNNFMCYLTYAGGFATGSFVGMWIEQKLAIGIQVVRIITRKDAQKLITHLREAGYGITVINGQGATGRVKLIFTTIQRKDLKCVIGAIKHFNPKAFYSVEDIRSAAEGIFPNNGSRRKFRMLKIFRIEKKK